MQLLHFRPQSYVAISISRGFEKQNSKLVSDCQGEEAITNALPYLADIDRNGFQFLRLSEQTLVSRFLLKICVLVAFLILRQFGQLFGVKTV